MKKKIKNSSLKHNFSIADKYKKALNKEIKDMTKEVKSKTNNIFNTKNSLAIATKIAFNKLTKKYNKIFNNKSKEISKKLLEAIDKQSQSSLQTSFNKMAEGIEVKKRSKDIDEAIKASINENVNLIKTIPEQFLSSVEGATYRSITSGAGVAELSKFISKFERQTKRRAKNIALDQTRKAYNNINKARMEAVGITKYEWLHSHGGANPRPLHVSYDGKIFSFDNPPIIEEKTGERGIPGQAINCKCTMRPVIKFEKDE